jgi:hypothetical protein
MHFWTITNGRQAAILDPIQSLWLPTVLVRWYIDPRGKVTRGSIYYNGILTLPIEKWPPPLFFQLIMFFFTFYCIIIPTIYFRQYYNNINLIIDIKVEMLWHFNSECVSVGGRGEHTLPWHSILTRDQNPIV